jgi:hypothetical protein
MLNLGKVIVIAGMTLSAICSVLYLLSYRPLAYTVGVEMTLEARSSQFNPSWKRIEVGIKDSTVSLDNLMVDPRIEIRLSQYCEATLEIEGCKNPFIQGSRDIYFDKPYPESIFFSIHFPDGSKREVRLKVRNTKKTIL